MPPSWAPFPSPTASCIAGSLEYMHEDTPARISRTSANSCSWPFFGPRRAHTWGMVYPQKDRPVDEACVGSPSRLGLFRWVIPDSWIYKHGLERPLVGHLALVLQISLLVGSGGTTKRGPAWDSPKHRAQILGDTAGKCDFISQWSYQTVLDSGSREGHYLTSRLLFEMTVQEISFELGTSVCPLVTDFGKLFDWYLSRRRVVSGTNGYLGSCHWVWKDSPSFENE